MRSDRVLPLALFSFNRKLDFKMPYWFWMAFHLIQVKMAEERKEMPVY